MGMNALVVALLLAAAPDACEAPSLTSAPPKAEVLTRGEKLKGLTPVTLAQVLAAPSEYDGKTVAVEARVRRACLKKGCWMELAADDAGPGVRVTFKDYGFFVPRDSAGWTARVEGTVKVATVPAAQADHLEAEGARLARGAGGDAHEVRVVATGVELRK